MGRTCWLLAALVPPTIALHTQAASNQPTTDLKLLVTRFVGEFDNYAQWEADVEQNVSQTNAHSHLHSIFHGPVDAPLFGNQVYYVQQYMDGKPHEIYRQRLYSFAQASSDQPIVLSFFTFKDPTKFVDADKQPHKLDGLTRNDTIEAVGCEVYIRRVGDVFKGRTGEKCVVESHITHDQIRIEDDNTFGADFVTIHERGFDVKTGAQIFGSPTPSVLNRTRAARRFSGYVALETSPGKYRYGVNISAWDVGQIVPLSFEGEDSGYAIEIAYCVFAESGLVDPVLKLAIHKRNFTHDGLVVPVAYSWTQPDATQIGLNLRYLQAGFTLVKG